MKKHFQYLWYVLRHKWFVMLACFRYGLIWRGIIHDWSKFLPSEWFPYVDYFYGEFSSDQSNEWKRASRLGFSPRSKEAVELTFDYAWLMHQNRNKHHWQYWLLTQDSDGATIPMKMPIKYIREMLADWEGAGRAINGRNDTAIWYLKNRHNIKLHEDTRRTVEFLLAKDIQAAAAFSPLGADSFKLAVEKARHVYSDSKEAGECLNYLSMLHELHVEELTNAKKKAQELADLFPAKPCGE